VDSDGALEPRALVSCIGGDLCDWQRVPLGDRRTASERQGALDRHGIGSSDRSPVVWLHAIPLRRATAQPAPATTTSSAVIASAELAHNSVTGRRELANVREDYRSEIIFTPFNDSGLDEHRLENYLDQWLSAADHKSQEFFGGGALLTGLAAEEGNASVLVRLIRSRLGDALIATAGDPRLESWLAFQASAAGLSRSLPERMVLNLDIGGGTTNIALGMNGEVLRTGCLFVGARHVQVVPGTYQIVKLSSFARRLLDHLRIMKGPGDCLADREVKAIVDFDLRLIEAAVAGERDCFLEPVARLHETAPFEPPDDLRDPIVTLSGGVGELVYAHLAGKPLPTTTFFGDLGIDLAARLLTSPKWGSQFRTYVPACAGRATVYGLLRHTTQVSGSTLFLPNAAVLPLRDLPILGQLSPNSTDLEIRDILQLVRASPKGGCLHVVLNDRGAEAVAALGKRIAATINELDLSGTQPLVLIVRENVGKALGNYVGEWGASRINLVVLDEIEVRDARFVQIGKIQNQVVPVSFYGLN
jgi:ethanolamine utilization protein EutA